MGSPKQNPKPSIDTLLTSLSRHISRVKTEEILRTYHITIPAAPVPASDRQLTDPNLADSLLTILENLFFYKGTAEFIAHAQAHSKHKVIVRQFIFQQRNPLLTAGNFTISQPMFWISFIFIGRRESLMIL